MEAPLGPEPNLSDREVPVEGDYNTILDLGVSPTLESVNTDTPSEHEVIGDPSADATPNPEVVKAMLTNPFFSRRLRRLLTRLEINRMDTIRSLHTTLHMGKESLKNIVSGGTLGNSDLTAADVENYFELEPPCLACLANMRTPANEPYLIPSGRLPGTWWEMDAMLIRNTWYSIFVDGTTGQWWSLENVSMTIAGQKAAASKFLAFLRRTFPANDNEAITLIVDWQSSFGEYVNASRHVSILHSAVEGHTNRAEAAIKKIQHGYRTCKAQLPYVLPPAMDRQLVRFQCKLRGFLPSTSRSMHSAYSQVYGCRLDLSALARLQFGAMGRAIVPKSQRKGSKLSAGQSRDVVIIGFERSNPTNLILLVPDTLEIISRATGFTFTPVNPTLVAAMNALNARQTKSTGPTAELTSSESDPAPAVVNESSTLLTDAPLGVISPQQQLPVAVVSSGLKRPIDSSNSKKSTPIDRSKMTVKQAASLFPSAKVGASLGVEFDNLERNKVLRPVLAIPNSKSTVIRGHVIMKEKQLDGVADKLKARLVADGNGQDLKECGNTKAPTIDRSTFHLLMALCQKVRGRIWSVDIPSAFLNAPLNMDKADPPPAPIYMILGASTAALLIEALPQYRKFLQKNGTLIFEIMMSLYGLRNSPRNWFLFLCQVILRAKMVQSVSDRCLFSWHGDRTESHVAFWVDDIFGMGNDGEQKARIIGVLQDQFGKLDVKEDRFNFLGLYVGLQDDHSITVDNTAYILSILRRRWTEEIGQEFHRRRGVLTPGTEDLFLGYDDNHISTPQEIEDYQTIVGELLFATFIRVDILKEVIFLSTRNHRPCDRARRACRQVIAYLKLNSSRPVNFGSRDLTLHAYPDAAYAVHSDGFSHSGLFITLGPNGGPIYVRSKKQKMITKSSSEAELIAASSIVDAAKFLSKIMLELKMIKKIHFVLMEDNTSTIFILKNGEGVGGKAKHFLTRYQEITDLVSSGMITLRHCPTEDMIADYLTKGMIGPEFARQAVRAMYHGNSKEQDDQGQRALVRIDNNKSK